MMASTGPLYAKGVVVVSAQGEGNVRCMAGQGWLFRWVIRVRIRFHLGL